MYKRQGPAVAPPPSDLNPYGATADELKIEDLITSQVNENPWQFGSYSNQSATWQGAAQRRHMHRRRTNAALGVASVDLSGPHEAIPMVGQKIGGRPGHYFVALTIDPATATGEAGCQTEPTDAAAAQVVTPEEAPDTTRHLRPPLVYATVISTKAEAGAAVMQLLATVRDDHATLPREVVIRLHSDRAQELLPDTLEAYCKLHAIKRTTTAGYDPSANGAAENAIGFLKRKSRHLLSGSRLPTNWWGTAVVAAAYLSRCTAGLLPWPALAYGTRCMVVKDPPPRNAFAPRSMPGAIIRGVRACTRRLCRLPRRSLAWGAPTSRRRACSRKR